MTVLWSLGKRAGPCQHLDPQLPASSPRTRGPLFWEPQDSDTTTCLLAHFFYYTHIGSRGPEASRPRSPAYSPGMQPSSHTV